MEKNELAKAGKNLLTDLVGNDKLEGLPKVAAYTGLALLELAKLVLETKEAKERLQWRKPHYVEQKVGANRLIKPVKSLF